MELLLRVLLWVLFTLLARSPLAAVLAVVAVPAGPVLDPRLLPLVMLALFAFEASKLLAPYLV
jgi:hypothetical protein